MPGPSGVCTGCGQKTPTVQERSYQGVPAGCWCGPCWADELVLREDSDDEMLPDEDDDE